MKGLVKDVSSVVIAGLILASGAIAANGEVVMKKVETPQNTQKIQNTQKTQQSQVAATALPVAKKVATESPNQAKYLKSSPSVVEAEPSIFLAQETAPSALRDQLKIKPLSAAYLPAASGGNSPSLNFGTPSGFGAYWGSAFISASGATPGSKRDGNIDGSISVGFGLGSSDTIGAEFSYNQGSIKNFGQNGTFDAKVHRMVYSEGTNQVSVSVGWNTFAQHVTESVGNSSVYAAISSYSQLQAGDKYNTMPISFSVGVGGGTFRKDPANLGVFGGFGVQVHPQFSVGAAWSGVGINAGVSYVPYPEIPLTFVLTGGDLTESSFGGRVVVLSASYGFSFAK